ncbi:hypothetical protein TH61_17675 [Rufibacter sp. DG15C]|uniref:TlpA disulfide reductase family protein n=1 Tax=Rufibacter sp. DG15C TaxID=1379909 RepID=UPI00078BE179|nr:TlpA disulfide reductase family protein [Rufibacter sp. DG15C]AMM52636.1 hypothetical protein TH61_17675 [Rufibacter sp. DG15C]
MRNAVAATAALILMASCSHQKPAEDIITIQGTIKSLPDGKVYLAEATSWALLDSTVSKGGDFKFEIQPDSSFVPTQVAIQYKPRLLRDSTEKYVMLNGFKRIYLRNHMMGADSLKYYNASFYLERGLTKVEQVSREKSGNNIYTRVYAGKQTDALFLDKFGEFGYLANLEGSARNQKINVFKEDIKKHPYSIHYLFSLYSNKEQYSEKELQEMLRLFNQEARQSTLGRKIYGYLENRVDAGTPYKNFQLAGPDKKQGWIMNNAAKVNMLVFWASWCGPCRREIPALKTLHASYKDKGVNMVSISIDEQQENWHKALTTENMPWQQLVVEKDKIDQVQHTFNFSAIPLVVITDSQGKEVKRIVGEGEESIQLIKDAVQKQLAL